MKWSASRKFPPGRKGKRPRPGKFGPMPRAIWSGAISFGLVNIPVKLFSAVSRKTVRFHQLDQVDNQRIQQKRINPRTGEEVPYENLVKGYEIAPDRYVVITPEELDSLGPEKTRTIDIEDFVELDQIDPIYYDHPYYLAPDTGASKAYRLLLDAMQEAGKVAIARVVIRSKENLVAIRPRDGVLTMETMLFADEVVSPEDLDAVPENGKAKTTKRELQMAQQLIDSLSGEFEPDKYRDEYRDSVLDLIERKAEGEEIVIEAPAEEPKKVPDLMAALEASIASSKGQGGGKRAKPKGRQRASAESGDGKPASSRKKTAKKS
jgi:DNA end-binding protein Ku